MDSLATHPHIRKNAKNLISETDTMIKYRPHDWFNTKTNSPAYGIQAKEDRGPWVHVRRGEDLLIFATAAERYAELENLRKQAGQDEVPAPGPSP
jgi:hypothetical protein